jgi:hypothetical protein
MKCNRPVLSNSIQKHARFSVSIVDFILFYFNFEPNGVYSTEKNKQAFISAPAIASKKIEIFVSIREYKYTSMARTC